ncbi:N-acetylmuramoyl-L-alanine amidase [Streptomyces coelicoflavus]|uniref:N-acetylmuramoyl-L-alanine amidase n=1 Tax=Streptomyces coelicoflavus TaxID=285562 RepID=UPI001582F4B9|nr:N-acetylmuramoyl-L-alanine amidase [Streptomyces coelicoflavus]
MATPMSASAFVKALRDEGLTVVEVGDWRDHNRNHKGAWGPVNGVMIHHTVTRGSARTVDICRHGYASLPGPLCHGVITKDGRVHLVGYGRANHAGLGDDDVLRAVVNEKPLPADNEANTDGNRHFYGFECENLGDGKDPWPAVQLEAIERAAAAICRHHGWNERSVIGHLEWQPGKVDPRGFTMASMRARIADRLHSNPSSNWKPSTPSTPKEDLDMDKGDVFDATWDTDKLPAPSFAPDVKKNPRWTASSYIRSIYNAVAGLPAALAALRKDVAALRADIAALKKES